MGVLIFYNEMEALIMGMLDRATLLKPQELKIQKVELGGDDFVFVKEMTGFERDNFEQSMMEKKKSKDGSVTFEQVIDNFRSKLAVNTVCDEKGVLVLRPDDYNALAKAMGISRLETIVNAAQKLNKISNEDREELVKNSSNGPSDDSTSA